MKLAAAALTAVSVLAALLATAIIMFAVIISHQDDRITATCRFYQLIATLHVPASPAPGAPSIDLVIDSRAAYTGLGCGMLPPPSAQLKRWAAYYKVRV